MLSIQGEATQQCCGSEAPNYAPPIDVPRILLLCTANRCRSPMAEGVLRHLLAERGAVADVGSAGLYEGGIPATGLACAVLGRRGIDITAHRSRTLDDPDVDVASADLLVGMERRHVQEAALLGAIQARCFTLPELARRAQAVEPRRSGESLAAWAERVAAGRMFTEFVGLGPSSDEIPDPVGLGEHQYEQTAQLLVDLLTTVVDRAFPRAAEEVA